MLNLTEILRLLPAMQGLVFIGIFITFFNARKSYKYALLYITTLSLINVFEYFGVLHIYNLSVYSYFLIPFLVLISFPVFYLYVLSLIKENLEIKRNIFIHLFIPTVISISAAILFFMVPYEERYMFVENYYPDNEPFSVYLQYYFDLYVISNSFVYYLLFFTYSGLIVHKIGLHRKRIKEQFSEISKIKLNWILLILTLVVIYTFWEFYLFINKGYLAYQNYYYIFKYIYVFLFGIFAFRQKEIYFEDEISHYSKTNELGNEDNSEDIILARIISCLEDEKMYLNQNVCLKDVAKAVNIHKNVLSKIINSRLNMNFFAWVNSYRIQEAKRLLESRENDKYTIDAIGELSGFKSKSAFYPLFKANTGKTPLEYRNIKL